MVYVADRENGRIEKFDRKGRLVGVIDALGRVYALKLAGGALWASMGPFDQAPGAPGWVVKLDPHSGRMLGHLDVSAEQSGHALEMMPSGEPVVTAGDGLLWFKREGPAVAARRRNGNRGRGN